MKHFTCYHYKPTLTDDFDFQITKTKYMVYHETLIIIAIIIVRLFNGLSGMRLSSSYTSTSIPLCSLAQPSWMFHKFLFSRSSSLSPFAPFRLHLPLAILSESSLNPPSLFYVNTLRFSHSKSSSTYNTNTERSMKTESGGLGMILTIKNVFIF